MKGLLATLLLACAAACAFAQAYPAHPIRFVASFPPGGGVDLMSRLVAGALSARVGQPVVVENRAGAVGVLGTAVVARAAPDGYTVLVTADAPITQAHLLNKLPYEPYRDFVPLVKGVAVPTSVVVAADSPFRTFKDLIDHARAHPGKLSWGSPGIGSSMHVELEMLKDQLGLDIVHVPYKGGAPLVTDTLGGQVGVGSVGLPSTIAHIRSGRLRLLAVWAPTRVGLLPDVPTVREVTGAAELVGLPTWYGFLLPTGVAPPIATRLEGEIVAALREPEVSRRLAESGAVLAIQTRAEFEAANRALTAAFAAQFKRLGLKPE